MTPSQYKPAWDWRGTSQIVNSLGRIKTERQILLDGQRVNQYSNVAMSTTGQCDRSAQIRKAGI